MTRLRGARRALFGTRSRVAGFLGAVVASRVTARYRGLRWTSAILMMLLAFQLSTGVLLSLYYYPEPDAAYRSTRFLVGEVSSGWLIRSIHHWAGELVLLTAIVHLAFVYFRRAYARPREYEWVCGLILLLTLLALRFTGRLLPWDDIGYATARRGLEMMDSVPVIGGLMARWLRGGDEMGPYTLSRFFTSHALILPWFGLAVSVVHLYLVRRHGLKEDES